VIVRTYFLLLALIGAGQLGYSQTCSGPLSVTVIGASSAQPIIIDEQSSDIYCANSSEGDIYLTLYGGTPQYEYQWSHDTIRTEIATDLPEGNYTVTVTDANGCSEKKTIAIIQVDPLLDSLQLLSMSACGDCHLADGMQSFFYFEDEYIAAILDLETEAAMGRTRVCADIVDDTPYAFGDALLQRCWTVESEVQEQADYRLFFSDEELTALARTAGYITGEDLILSQSLYVNYYKIGADQGIEQTPVQLLSGEFTLTRYDEQAGVWSLELYQLPNAKVELAALQGVLPLELLSFGGRVESDHNALTWSTASEVALRGFMVQRSGNGILFDSIAWVDAGDDEYNHNDFDVSAGDHYYRLYMLDLDGSAEYSHIVRLRRDYNHTFEVVNNPFTDVLFAEVGTNKASTGSISVLSINGQMVHSSRHELGIGITGIQLDLSSMPSGNYIIRYSNDGESVGISKKIVKI